MPHTVGEKIGIAGAVFTGVGSAVVVTRAAYSAVNNHRPISANKFVDQGKKALNDAQDILHLKYEEDPVAQAKGDFIIDEPEIRQFQKRAINPLVEKGKGIEADAKTRFGPATALWPAYKFRGECEEVKREAETKSGESLQQRREETHKRRLDEQVQQQHPVNDQQVGGSLGKVCNPAQAPSHQGHSQPTASLSPPPTDKGKLKGVNPGGSQASSGITTRDAGATRGLQHVQYPAPVGVPYENASKSRPVVSDGHSSLPMYYKGQVPNAGHNYASQNNVNWNSNTPQGGQYHAYPPGRHYPAQESHNTPPAVGPPRSRAQPTVGSRAHSQPMYYNGRAPDVGRETHQPYENDEDQVGPLQGDASGSQVSGNHSAMAGSAYHGPTTRMGQGRSTSVDSASSYATAKSYHSTRTTKGNRS